MISLIPGIWLVDIGPLELTLTRGLYLAFRADRCKNWTGFFLSGRRPWLAHRSLPSTLASSIGSNFPETVITSLESLRLAFVPLHNELLPIGIRKFFLNAGRTPPPTISHLTPLAEGHVVSDSFSTFQRKSSCVAFCLNLATDTPEFHTEK